MSRPVIAITMADAAGIGPELIVKVLSDPVVYDRCKPFIVGDLRVMPTWSCGSQKVIYLAALQGIPSELYESADESAASDGANKWTRFRPVTAPMISPAILFNTIIAPVAAFQYFPETYVITSGGPDDSTLFYSLSLYKNAFSYFKLGYALQWLGSIS
jgi:ABC-type sugar transport system permease subunit